jgi:hypothetical protein
VGKTINVTKKGRKIASILGIGGRLEDCIVNGSFNFSDKIFEDPAVFHRFGARKFRGCLQLEKISIVGKGPPGLLGSEPRSICRAPTIDRLQPFLVDIAGTEFGPEEFGITFLTG